MFRVRDWKENCKRARERVKFTQVELAERLGVTHGAIQKLERISVGNVEKKQTIEEEICYYLEALPGIKGWYSTIGTKSTHIAPNQLYRKDLGNHVHILQDMIFGSHELFCGILLGKQEGEVFLCCLLILIRQGLPLA